MKNSEIGWTKHTYNPWEGCSKVSPGCENCYAKTDVCDRWGRTEWGPRAKRRRVTGTIDAPLKWHEEAISAGRRDKVFCASLCDVFDDHPSIEQEWRDDLWSKIRLTPCLQWLLLSKRPENFSRFLPDDWGDGYNNVCLMVSTEDQEWAEKRIPILLDTPARWHGLSCEPLLGPIDLTPWLSDLDWVIAGGESGTAARPMEPEWARGLRDQCAAADVSFFFKQWGAWAPAKNTKTQ
ncbi:MAG: protein gp37 [Gammaproteobacteria bacterium]|jgi:protein gp37